MRDLNKRVFKVSSDSESESLSRNLKQVVNRANGVAREVKDALHRMKSETDRMARDTPGAMSEHRCVAVRPRSPRGCGGGGRR